MARNLIIVESPAKAKTINKILGKDFVVKASMGHVRDLPVRTLGVNIEKDFAPSYVLTKGREKVIKEICDEAAKCENIYLAPDPDREGEAIAWHLAFILKDKAPHAKIHRVTYNEITPRAIRAAIESPGPLNQPRVDAQQARRILDRIVGYRVSPLLWSKIKSGLSAGRVQSVALRLVCEREKEIRGFVPEAYWVLGANVRKLIDPRTPFPIRLARVDGEKAEVKQQELADNILRDLASRELVVTDIKLKEVTRRAPPPFITSTLQQAGSRIFGWSPQRTMRLAQELYEGVDLDEGTVGLITYMRTDSFNIAREALDDCRAVIGDRFGAEYVPEQPNFFRSRASAQEAHEAIRPTDVRRTPDSLRSRMGPDELKLYSVVWNRFVASQMAAARIAQRTVEFDAALSAGAPARDAAGGAPHTYLFRASASDVVFPGYMKLAGDDAKKEEDSDEVEQLPPLEKGEKVECIDWVSDRKETQPPGRFSEASLIRALEENGVGRPSTYAQTIGTLQAREYVTREKRTLFPTELGMNVNDLLVTSLSELFDVQFTAGMEKALDEVEEGHVEWTSMLKDFYAKFTAWMSAAKGPPADSSAALRIIRSLDVVTEWAPEVKRGKRTYGDRRFIESVEKQISEAKRPLSHRQLVVLGQIAYRYREKAPDVEKVLAAENLTAEVVTPASAPPKETTLRKLEVLRHVKIEPPPEGGEKKFSEVEFLASLRARTEGGRSLSPAQLSVLDRIVMRHAKEIPDFESIRESLGLNQMEVANAEESKAVLGLMENVKEWRPAVKRGKREFDDKAFFTSLSTQLAAKGVLSPRQHAALQRMAGKYHAQIPNFDEIAERLNLKRPKRDMPKEAKADEGDASNDA